MGGSPVADFTLLVGGDCLEDMLECHIRSRTRVSSIRPAVTVADSLAGDIERNSLDVVYGIISEPNNCAYNAEACTLGTPS